MPDPGTSVAVLGAGPAGLGAAYMLAQRGISVVVLEQLDRVGGNAGSFELAGIPVDFGSHRLHPASDPAILEMIRKLTGDDLLERPRHGRIHRGPDIGLEDPTIGPCNFMLVTTG